MQAQPEFGFLHVVGPSREQVARQFEVVFEHDARVVLADQPVLAVTEQALHGIVDEEESAVGAKQEHQVGRAVEHDLAQQSDTAVPLELLRVPQRLAGAEETACSVGSVFAHD